MSNPRDLGFNYGRGWGSEPKPPLYHEAMKVARQLGRDASDKSTQAWALEMALRNVRLASTGVEKAVALKELAAELRRAGSPWV